MVSEWQESTIGDVCTRILTGGTPLKSNDEYFENANVPWLKTKEVNFCRIYETENHISDIGLRESAAKLVPTNSVIVAMYGQGDTAGRVAINKVPLCTNQACCNLIIDEVKANYQYIYYTLKGSYSELVRRKIGSAQPNLNTKIVKAFEIPVPPLPEQKAIAHILGSLDDKIELNRRMNATLEGMAQALFKSWFVDFDPVIDNALAAGNPIPEELAERAEVRRKALADGTANREAAKQFPAAFQLSEEMGWIPEGWKVKGLGSIAQNVRTSANPTILSEDTPYVGLEHIDRHAFSLTRWGYAPDVDSQKSRFESNDFLFGKLRPYFHKVCQVQTGGICSTDILVIRPKENTYSGFVGCQIFEPEFVEYANLRSTGTRMPRASWKDMAKYAIALPAPQLIETFNNIVQPAREKCKRTVEESQTLIKLRDTLLPKLISGELRIPEAEKKAEGVPA